MRNRTAINGRICRRGFTLIEMITVIAVIMFLVGALFVGTNRLRARARLGATNVLIEKVRGGLEAYKLFYRAYPTPFPLTGYSSNESLHYYLTTSFRMNPSTANGEVPSTLNVGPLCQFSEQETIDPNNSGRRTIIDSWKSPLVFGYNTVLGDADPRAGWTQTQTIVPFLYSCGPNKVDDKGAVDDISSGK
jgi:prepilin-type N-terminal cleavage/methylation domain-containing protein